ncbi:hemin uptake protein HemP [Superficieibacter sp. HKU1]|uniref:hemin uptake protein HemP n=1 Tax=Superficieibacter sp. HKU1 TaxID=3031919 RepID=UPI0023E20E32|nr:hemin uptake protein HemP [Superficieibacter sp. HKU1]WES70664.1 hemin uptake protein HemP [Superficieibacter sp. HKU1]
MIINTKLIIILYYYAMQSTDLAETGKRYAPHPEPEDRRIDSNELLGREGRVVIEHDGQQYLLRQTQAGKLILTK